MSFNRQQPDDFHSSSIFTFSIIQQVVLLLVTFLITLQITSLLALCIQVPSLIFNALSTIIVFGGTAIIYTCIINKGINISRLQSSLSIVLPYKKEGRTWQQWWGQYILLFLATILAAEALILFSSWLIQQMPAHLQEAINAHTLQQEEHSKQFFKKSDTLSVLLQLFVYAVLPATCEEMLLRGSIQPLLIRLMRNKHTGIICTAAIFSAMHLSIVNALPIFVFGLVFGYMTYSYKSILPSMLLHFINNSTVVLLSHLT